MRTQIQSLHFDADKKLLQLIEEKLYKLTLLYDRIEDCVVTLRIDKNSKNKNKVIEINLTIPHHNLFVKELSTDFEIGFRDALDKLKILLVKHKEKIGAFENTPIA